MTNKLIKDESHFFIGGTILDREFKTTSYPLPDDYINGYSVMRIHIKIYDDQEGYEEVFWEGEVTDETSGYYGRLKYGNTRPIEYYPKYYNPVDLCRDFDVSIDDLIINAQIQEDIYPYEANEVDCTTCNCRHMQGFTGINNTVNKLRTIEKSVRESEGFSPNQELIEKAIHLLNTVDDKWR